jgi:uncharacterized RDD family membrane protein YckC
MTCVAHPLHDETTPCGRCGEAYCDDCLVTLRDTRVCAACKDEVVRDVISGAVDHGLPLAGFRLRALAWLVDRAILWILQYGAIRAALRIHWPSSASVVSSRWLLQSGLAIFFVLYEGFLVAARGQTVGKLLLRIRVVRPDQAPVTRGQAWIRATVRFTGALIILVFTVSAPAFGTMAYLVVALLDYVPALITTERTTLHDLLARTRVIRVEE